MKIKNCKHSIELLSDTDKPHNLSTGFGGGLLAPLDEAYTQLLLDIDFLFVRMKMESENVSSIEASEYFKKLRQEFNLRKELLKDLQEYKDEN
jgi:hypothetical protein